jgi:hypothetical protein
LPDSGILLRAVGMYCYATVCRRHVHVQVRDVLNGMVRQTIVPDESVQQHHCELERAWMLQLLQTGNKERGVI